MCIPGRSSSLQFLPRLSHVQMCIYETWKTAWREAMCRVCFGLVCMRSRVSLLTTSVSPSVDFAEIVKSTGTLRLYLDRREEKQDPCYNSYVPWVYHWSRLTHITVSTRPAWVTYAVSSYGVTAVAHTTWAEVSTLGAPPFSLTHLNVCVWAERSEERSKRYSYYENNQWTIFPSRPTYYTVPPTAQDANTRSYQLHWGCSEYLASSWK